MLRPWLADDGLLVRLRLIGGRIRVTQLTSLIDVAERFGDGRIHVTSRANLQLRAFPGTDGRLAEDALAAIEGTGLLPTRSHELVRNIMLSPQSGLAGGRADLRELATGLDGLLCAGERLAALPGKFLFVLDDGRGDLVDRPGDLGVVALDGDTAQLRAGDAWGPTLPLRYAAARLVDLADAFLRVRGAGLGAAWHVDELGEPLIDPPAEPDPRLPSPSGPLPYGEVAGGIHLEVPESGLDRTAVADLTHGVPEIIITPWRGVLVPKELSNA